VPAKRRSPGEGSIHAWQGRFRGYVTLPSEIVDGKVRRRRRYAYGDTKADVRIALGRIREDLVASAGTLSTAADRTTLAQYLRDWVDGLEVRPNTKRQYEWIVDDYLIPRLGILRLDRIDYAALETFRVRLRKDGIGDRTRQLCHDVLRVALRRAVRAKIIPSNPIESVERPRTVSREVDPWSASETMRVLKAARDDRYHAVYEIMLRLGPQFPGEVFGLRWEDVDLEKGTLRIGAQLGAGGKRAATKTDFRRRSLDLPKPVVDALVAHRERAERENRLSPKWVFATSTGNAMSPRQFVRDSFDPLLARANVRRIRPYDMRHTFATLALVAGVHIKTVSRILGHSNVVETLRTYSHFVPAQLADANDRVGALLGDDRSEGSREGV